MKIECRKCAKGRRWNHKQDGPLAKLFCECGGNEWNRSPGLPTAPQQVHGLAGIPPAPRPGLPLPPNDAPGQRAALRRFRSQAEACERTRCPRGNLKHCAGGICADFRAVPVANPNGTGIAGSILACGCGDRRAAESIGYVASNQQAAQRIATVIEAVTKASYAPQDGAA